MIAPTISEMSEADLISSRSSLILAQSHSLVRSWLPPKTAGEISNEKTEDELEAEDRESLTIVPDQYARKFQFV